MRYATRAFWTATAERAIKTGAQVTLLALGAEQLNVFNLDWVEVGGLGLGGVLLPVITSVASSAVTTTSGPSLVEAEILAKPAQAVGGHPGPLG